MRIKVDFSELQQLANRINPSRVDFSLFSEYASFTPLDIQLEEGLEIDLDAIDVVGNLLSYNGRQVLLYIKDHSNKMDATLANPAKGNRFHVAHCRTLEDMRQRNRFQRYVATNKLNGLFTIEDPFSFRRIADTELCVCMNCLSKLNYDGSAFDNDKRLKVFRNFSISQFFSRYSSCFLYMPKAWRDDQTVGYSDDWREVSDRLRAKAEYTCEDCGVCLRDHRSLCHVHHINGVKSDNAPGNLQVLCKDCHRRKPNHFGIFVSHREMQIITELRRKGGLTADSSWEEVFQLADPAVAGDLEAIRVRQRLSAPVVGYEVLDARGAVIAELEAAWPEKKMAIVVKDVEIPGWRIYRVGDICGG